MAFSGCEQGLSSGAHGGMLASRLRRQVLIAGQGTDVSKLAGAMAARLRGSEVAAVRSVGPMALEKAMKALLRARHWLRRRFEALGCRFRGS